MALDDPAVHHTQVIEIDVVGFFERAHDIEVGQGGVDHGGFALVVLEQFVFDFEGLGLFEIELCGGLQHLFVQLLEDGFDMPFDQAFDLGYLHLVFFPALEALARTGATLHLVFKAEPDFF